MPAMAVAAELRDSGAAVSFLGTRERIEAELVPAAGYEIDFIKVRGIDRGNPLKAAAAALEAGVAVGAARSAIRRRGADVVLGGGGFVAGPAGLAARSAGTPLVLTEADSHLGLANRLLAARARRVCLAFPIDGREGEPLCRHRAPGPRRRAGRRPRHGTGPFRDPAPPAACWWSAAARAPARSTSARSPPSPSGRAATSTSSTSPAAATTPS